MGIMINFGEGWEREREREREVYLKWLETVKTIIYNLSTDKSKSCLSPLSLSLSLSLKIQKVPCKLHATHDMKYHFEVGITRAGAKKYNLIWVALFLQFNFNQGELCGDVIWCNH